MKNIMPFISILLLSFFFVACEENDVMPSFSTKGTTTATVATITASKASPSAGETITLALEYVNPTSDPVNTIVLKAKVGSADYVMLQSFDEQSSQKDVFIKREASYVAPAAGSKVTFDMIISSQKEYSQIKRITVTVK
ncbi:MAG TPA: hypothetical protein VJ184_08350 [Chryseolinea sp.]|nr:hypothetical protein [Chryseolinea sp.]